MLSLGDLSDLISPGIPEKIWLWTVTVTPHPVSEPEPVAVNLAPAWLLINKPVYPLKHGVPSLPCVWQLDPNRSPPSLSSLWSQTRGNISVGVCFHLLRVTLCKRCSSLSKKSHLIHLNIGIVSQNAFKIKVRIMYFVCHNLIKNWVDAVKCHIEKKQ